MSSFEEIDPTIFDFSSLESLDVGQCSDCPKVGAHLRDIETVEYIKSELTKEVTHPEFEKFIQGDFSVAVESGFVRGVEDASGEIITDSQKLAETIRRMTADNISESDDDIGELKEDIDCLVLECEGPQVLRGVKAGRSIVIIACNSPQLLFGKANEEVSVERESATDDN